MTSRYERIHDILTAGFKPAYLEILDESAKHAGHSGQMMSSSKGETHYRIVLISDVFFGQSRLVRYRAVHAALEPEFKTGLHAVSLKLQDPEEVKA